MMQLMKFQIFVFPAIDLLYKAVFTMLFCEYYIDIGIYNLFLL